MKKMKFIFVMFSLLLVVFGCSNQEKSMESYSGAEEMTTTSYDSSRGVTSDEMEMDVAVKTEAVDMADYPTNESRMVIYHGHVSIEVKDYDQAKDDIQTQVKNSGGYVVESYFHEGREGQLSGSMVVRIPQQQFQPLLVLLADHEWKLLEQQISGNDVTEEFVDLESRLRAKRVVEERLLSFMDEADNTENLLKISNELAKVQAEIEQILGRKQYLENQVDYATLSIHIQENSLPMTIQGEDLNTWERSKELFIETINVIIRAGASLVIFIIGLSPVLLPFLLFLGAFILFKRRKRKEL
jgi:hypothetical protein